MNIDTKKIRKRLLLNQTEFAKLLNISLQTVSNWETGTTNISIKNKRKIIELCKKKGII